jgi:hypothetical protein
MEQRTARPIRRCRWAKSTVYAGGYILTRSLTLVALMQAEKLSLRDLRVALAGLEAEHSNRLNTEGTRDPEARGPPDLRPKIRLLTGLCSQRQVQRSLSALDCEGLPTWLFLSRQQIQGCVVSPSIAIPDRPVPFPRRWIRQLAREGTRAMIATTIGHLLRGSFLRGSVVYAGGTCSNRWIAENLNIDERSVKRARRTLVQLGWIAGCEQARWHAQRFGKAFQISIPRRVDAAEVRSSVSQAQRQRFVLSPPAQPIGTGLTPLRENKNLPLRGSEYQKRPAGWLTDLFNAHRTSDRGGLTTLRIPDPTLRDVRRIDLDHSVRLDALFAEAHRMGYVGRSEADRVQFFTTACYAKRVAQRPEALFASLVRKGHRMWGTNQDEDNARRLASDRYQ